MIADVEVRRAATKGLGVFARRPFDAGEFIFRRRHGRIIASSKISGLSEDDQRHLCELDFETSAVLLPPGCYLNHSCDPNAMRHGVVVFAWRPIDRDEEITIDYRLNAFDDDSCWHCSCGSRNCSGEVVGSFFALPEATQRVYIARPAVHRSRGAPTTANSPGRRAITAAMRSTWERGNGQTVRVTRARARRADRSRPASQA